MEYEVELYRLEKEDNRTDSFVLTVWTRGGDVERLHLSRADLEKLCEGVLGNLREQRDPPRGRFTDGEAEVPPWVPLKDRPVLEDPPYELPLNPDPFCEEKDEGPEEVS